MTDDADPITEDEPEDDYTRAENVFAYGVTGLGFIGGCLWFWRNPQEGWIGEGGYVLFVSLGDMILMAAALTVVEMVRRARGVPTAPWFSRTGPSVLPTPNWGRRGDETAAAAEPGPAAGRHRRPERP